MFNSMLKTHINKRKLFAEEQKAKEKYESDRLDNMLKPSDNQVKKMFELFDDQLDKNNVSSKYEVPFDSVYNKNTNPNVFAEFPSVGEYDMCDRVASGLNKSLPNDSIYNKFLIGCVMGKNEESNKIFMKINFNHYNCGY